MGWGGPIQQGWCPSRKRKRHQGCPGTEERPCEGPVRRRPSASQGEANLWTAEFQTPSCRNCGKSVSVLKAARAGQRIPFLSLHVRIHKYPPGAVVRVKQTMQGSCSQRQAAPRQRVSRPVWWPWARPPRWSLLMVGGPHWPQDGEPGVHPRTHRYIHTHSHSVLTAVLSVLGKGRCCSLPGSLT